MAHRVITANRLQDGTVVWLAADGVWVEEVDRALASDDDNDVNALLAEAKALESAGRLIGVYEVDVELESGAGSQRLRPVRLRERIRARGPTVAVA